LTRGVLLFAGAAAVAGCASEQSGFGTSSSGADARGEDVFFVGSQAYGDVHADDVAVRMRARICPEFESCLLSFGEDAEVVPD
jgi:hypothetical protein